MTILLCGTQWMKIIKAFVNIVIQNFYIGQKNRERKKSDKRKIKKIYTNSK